MPDLDRVLAEIGQLVDADLHELLTSTTRPGVERFGHLIEYHLGLRDPELRPLLPPVPAGKRLRPALALLTSESVCGSREPARAAAVALELVHNFSLVHDDIQDRSDLRRHRPTVWRLWGDAQAINVGDALWALGNIVLLQAATVTAAQQSAALASAALRLIEGQCLDLLLQNGDETTELEKYLAMIDGKTAALFECACDLGALAADATPDERACYARFGRALGRAFQQQDDVLGIWGLAEETGKPHAEDVVNRKRGLPIVIALGRTDCPEWFRELYAPGPADTMPARAVDRVISYLDESGVRAQARELAQRNLTDARAALAEAQGREPAIEHLRALCQYLQDRM